MNKRFLKALVCIVLAMTLFGGCAKKKEPVETPNATAAVTAEESGGENNKQANAEAEQAYMAFLNGEMSVTTSEKFREDDTGDNIDGLRYGTYSYKELKAAIDSFEGHDSTTKYALVDFGQDGVNELAIRFDSIDTNFLNWVGIIKYNGEGLDMNYSYEDGYRSYSTLYSSGYLQMGGSIGAAAHVFIMVGFDKNGAGADIFRTKSYYGTFAESAAYDLQDGKTGLTGNYDDIAGASEMSVSEYIGDGAVKLSVSGWSEDAAVREREQALIGELEGMGAELVSEEEMNVLGSLAPYEAPEVTWEVWNGKEDADDDTDEKTDAQARVSISFPDEELLARPQDFFEFIADDTDNQVKVALSTNITVMNFRVLSLSIDKVKEDGTMVFSGDEMHTLNKLTPEKPLVVGLVFAGDIPNMGISYVDANGTERVYAIALSGQDGQPLLEEAELTR